MASAMLAMLAPGVVLADVEEENRQESPGENRDLNAALTFAASEAFFPYSFRDADGTVKGFACDITDAVARVMNLRIERVPVANTLMLAALTEGRVDAIQFWSETRARRNMFDFSVPITRAETVVVVRKGSGDVRSLADLGGRRVAVGQRGTVGERYLLERHPTAVPFYTETTLEFLQALSAGTINAAVMSRLTAVSMIERHGLRNLTVLGENIAGYDVRYCFTVRKGDALLLARLNEGLAILHTTGEFDAIYQRWFGRFGGRGFSALQVVSYVAVALALGCGVATWGYFRQRSLRHRIARQKTELTEQRSLLAALHDKHPQATLVLELPRAGPPLLVSFNPEASRLFWITPDTVPGRPLALADLPAEIAAYFRFLLAQPEITGVTTLREFRLETTHRLIETTAVPLEPGESGAARLIVLAADITSRRLLDQEVSQSRRLRAIGELVGGIAHEFNNLLTPILGTSALLQMERSDDRELRTALDNISQAARRAAELTRRLLAFGRRTDQGRTVVDAHETITGCFALLRPTIDRRIELVLEPAALPPLWINATDFNQVVFNLVINARDTLVEKLERTGVPDWQPRIRVRLEELPASRFPAPLEGGQIEGWQQITVEDNGDGMSAATQERIFEPFFTTKEVGKGTGLGLAMVWHLVTDWGGSVRVESSVGQGSRFHLLLPRWQPGAADRTETRQPAPAVTVPARRILIVEDDDLVAASTERILRHHGHHSVRLSDGMAAWEHLSTNPEPYDVLLLDLNMPGLSGGDLIRRLQERGHDGRIIVMSGRVGEQEAAEFRRNGVARVISKPFTPEELLSVVAS